MAGKVGAKGNIVIEKEIRTRLGVPPGWETVQLLRDGFVEIHFLPPVEPGGSAGRLRAKGDTAWLNTPEGFRQARDEAVVGALAEGYKDLRREDAA
jgi:bifunctional DNA-binding transcriptional regulator/antitoxin component of YhaV-PrlF toxin-antitoxin module